MNALGLHVAACVAAAMAGCQCGAAAERAVASSSLSGALPDAPSLRPRFLLVGARLGALRARARAGWPAWERLRLACDEALRRGLPEDGSGAENLAVGFLIGDDEDVGRAAIVQARRLMSRNLRFDSYLEFGNLLRGVALVRDHCATLLSEAEREAFDEYLAGACHELWFDNRGSGWGLDDPGNNYHMAFLEGTAYAALSLLKSGHPSAHRLWRLWREKFEQPGGVLSYLEERGPGGDWSEGTNYGQRAKQRLASALLAVSSMGGPEPARRVAFFADAVRFATHQLQPDGKSLLPTGDLARDSAMLVSPYDRDYVQAFAFLVGDEGTRARARRYLDRAAPSYEFGEFRWLEGLYKDVLFALDAPTSRAADESLTYLATGTGTLVARSDWTESATALSVVASPIVDQSHQHVDVGSFTLWKGGWQAVDASTYSRTGGLWQAGAHNMIHVEGHQRRPAKVPGLVRLSQRGDVLHARVDADGLYRARRDRKDVNLASEVRRELVYLSPDTLVVSDHVVADAPFDWRLHVPTRPRSLGGGRFESTSERGGLSLSVLVGGAAHIERDDDLEEGGSRSLRVRVEPAFGVRGGRVVAVIRVGLGGAPRLSARLVTSTAGLDVIALEDVLVALPRGRDAKLVGESFSLQGHSMRHYVVGLSAREVARVEGARVVITPSSEERTTPESDLQLVER